MMVTPPFRIPEVPMPATALPTMSILDDVATPQSKEPSMKTRVKDKKIRYRALGGLHWTCEVGLWKGEPWP